MRRGFLPLLLNYLIKTRPEPRPPDRPYKWTINTISPRLGNMYSPEEEAELKRRNYRSIREMIRLAYTVGFNLMDPSRCGQVLRMWVFRMERKRN